jgi:dCTP deaminase
LRVGTTIGIGRHTPLTVHTLHLQIQTWGISEDYLALSDLDIRKHKNKRLVIEPFEEKNLQPTGYDLALGYAILLSPSAVDGSYRDIDFSSYSDAKRTLAEMPKIVVPARTDVLVVSKERVHLSGKILAQVHARSSITAKGFVLNPLTVDPNFGAQHGRLMLRFFNCTDEDASLAMDERVATLVFHTVETETPEPPFSGSQEVVLTHYDHIPIAAYVYKYLHKYGNEDDDGEKAFKKAIKNMERFRQRWWIMRKLIQAKDNFSFRGFIPFSPLIALDLLTVVLRSVPSIASSVEVSPESLKTPAFWVSIVAANLAYAALVRSMSK